MKSRLFYVNETKGQILLSKNIGKIEGGLWLARNSSRYCFLKK